jgi:uncharacterized protein (TIGR02246 family)
MWQKLLLAILAAETQLNNAVMKHDVAATAKLITPDYTLTLGDGKVLNHAAFLTLVADPSFTYTVDRAEHQHVRFYGDDIAIVLGVLDIEGSTNRKSIVMRLQYTDTWVRINGAWRQAAGHSSVLGT